MNKKSAFNISFQAIVVLILAITILGLGLTFLRNMFGDKSLNETYFEQQTENITEETIIPFDVTLENEYGYFRLFNCSCKNMEEEVK